MCSRRRRPPRWRIGAKQGARRASRGPPKVRVAGACASCGVVASHTHSISDDSFSAPSRLTTLSPRTAMATEAEAALEGSLFGEESDALNRAEIDAVDAAMRKAKSAEEAARLEERKRREKWTCKVTAVGHHGKAKGAFERERGREGDRSKWMRVHTYADPPRLAPAARVFPQGLTEWGYVYTCTSRGLYRMRIFLNGKEVVSPSMSSARFSCTSLAHRFSLRPARRLRFSFSAKTNSRRPRQRPRQSRRRLRQRTNMWWLQLFIRHIASRLCYRLLHHRLRPRRPLYFLVERHAIDRRKALLARAKRLVATELRRRDVEHVAA
jgi:hypothetical protein